MNEQGRKISPSQEKYLLQTRPLVRRIVFGSLSKVHCDSAEDIEQQVFLKLWRWKRARSERDLSEEEWLKMANVAARREVTNFLSEKHRRVVLFSQTDEDLENKCLSAPPASGGSPPAFQDDSAISEREERLLLLWKAAQSLTLRQKYAFILHVPDFIVDFIASKCCSVKELADYFEMTEAELLVIMENDSFSDEQIGELLEQKLHKGVSPKSVCEARANAKAKITKHLAERVSDERLSERRNS